MLIFEKLIRKREVLISKVSIYMVIIIVLCHSVRLIPTIWEISQTFLEGEEVKSIWLKCVNIFTKAGKYRVSRYNCDKEGRYHLVIKKEQKGFFFLVIRSSRRD